MPNLSEVRECPICCGEAGANAFPYETRFNGRSFLYFKCAACSTVFVDPVPDVATFTKMYAKAAYHDCHYEGVDRRDRYQNSVNFLSRYIASGASVLDYGCGTGGFLLACVNKGFIPVGVDFDADVAQVAGERAACRGFSVVEFEALGHSEFFDVIHLGDVLEHLPDPIVTLSSIVKRLRPCRLLYVEGPLEVNPSFVYWSARAFGSVKRLIRPNFVATDPPTHLLRTDAPSQLRFFSRLDELTLVAEKIEETGWPYGNGGVVKRLIASLARGMGGFRVAGVVFGNRFRVVLRRQRVK